MKHTHTKFTQYIIYIKHILCLLLLCQISACGLIPEQPGKWTNPNKSIANIKIDHRSCIEETWKLYPVKMGYVSQDDGHWDNGVNATTVCNYSEYSKRTVCTYYPGKERAWVDNTTAPGDLNAKDRLNYYAKCMLKLDPAYKCIKHNETVDGTWCAASEG